MIKHFTYQEEEATLFALRHLAELFQDKTEPIRIGTYKNGAPIMVSPNIFREIVDREPFEPVAGENLNALDAYRTELQYYIDHHTEDLADLKNLTQAMYEKITYLQEEINKLEP